MFTLFRHASRMEDLALFTRHVGGAMLARAPLPDLLRAYARDAESTPLARAVERIAERVESGVELSVALEEFPRIFPVSYRKLVRLGEQGRTLGGVMRQLADQLEDGLKTYESFRRAAIYPVLVLVLLFLDVCFILAKITPKFVDIHLQLGFEMPGLLASPVDFTRLLLILFGLLLLAPIVFLTGTALGLRVRGSGFGRLALELPLVGPVLRTAETARFAGHLGLLLNNRIPLAEALELMAESADNRYVRAALQDFHTRYRAGEPLGDLIAAQPLFPAALATTVASAEDQGGLAETLGTMGRFYSQRTSHGLAVLREVFEPIMLLLIGLLVALILVSLYWPLFAMPGGIR